MKVTLEDVCERGSSNLKQSDVIDKDGKYPIYGAAGLIGHVDFFHQDKPYVAVVKDGAGIGRTTLLPRESSVIGTMQYLIPKDNVLPAYLYYVVRHMHLEKYFTGATIPHIYFKDYKKEMFSLCSTEEQRNIVNILERIEGIIAARKCEIDKLDELIKARFVEMFGECKNKRRLEEYTELITKGASPRWQGVEYSDKEEGTLFITSENVREGYIDYSKKKYLPDVINKILPRSVLKQNDILVNIVNASIGRSAIYDSEKLANINQAVALVRVKPNMLNLTFLLAYLNSEEAIRSFDYMKVGGDKANLSLKNISDLQIPVVDLELQSQFAAFVHQVDKSKVVA